MKLEILSEKPKGTPKQTPILFVHGAWHGAWCWEKFLPYDMMLEKNWQAVADRMIAWLNEKGLGD